MYSCMQGLSPASIIAQYRNGLSAKGITADKSPEYSGISNKREYRKVPVSRLVRRLGLTKYNVDAPVVEKEIETKRVTVMLSQNIGAPSVAVVKKGDKVAVGQLIGKAPEDKLGVSLHSPIYGKVAVVNEKAIIIEKSRK